MGDYVGRLERDAGVWAGEHDASSKSGGAILPL
jgi:hypothetical protein